MNRFVFLLEQLKLIDEFFFAIKEWKIISFVLILQIFALCNN